MENLNPYSALARGLLIGLSAVLFSIWSGRRAGGLSRIAFFQE
ncbi:hypothetical protein [Methylomicrobium sp. Wu6]|nr:hypothetical protein [Methylomicrobium sp. Wu6]MEC4750337.1 hypothetical protein [Methylomicrobium sp. Wu6]